MAGIKHKRQVTLAESLDNNIEIDYTQWNEEHVIDNANISVSKLNDKNNGRKQKDKEY